MRNKLLALISFLTLIINLSAVSQCKPLIYISNAITVKNKGMIPTELEDVSFISIFAADKRIDIIDKNGTKMSFVYLNKTVINNEVKYFVEKNSQGASYISVIQNAKEAFLELHSLNPNSAVYCYGPLKKVD